MTPPLDRPLRLVGHSRHYDWGDRDFIPRLCGRQPSGQPEAELWFGAHPDAPAEVVLAAGDGGGSGGGTTTPLDRLIAERRHEMLGLDAPAAGTAAPALPFLTKILSAARPLSVQVHPNREQAVRAFAAEARAAEARSAAAQRPDRSYRDRNHKPELLYALTPFAALSGFRPAAEASRLLAALGLERLRRPARRLASEGAAAYRALLEALHGQRGTDLAAAAASAARRAAAPTARGPRHEPPAAELLPDGREAMGWVERIARHYPNDPLVIAPLVLRLVHLEPGEALFVAPGVPHSYLEGSALEVMASSDNVLRLGLTTKRVDAAALLEVLVCEAAADGLLQPRIERAPWGTRSRFQPPLGDFALDVLELGSGSAPLLPEGRARIALVLSGEVEAKNAAGSARLTPGQAALLPAAAKAVAARGPGTLALTA